MGLISCDTFVCLPPNTENNCIIFGKNSDRPDDEVQEIIFAPLQEHPKGSKQRCTYIEIDQVPTTYAVILSKPSWMWGAEMGANQFGVCIGNEAVWTKLNDAREDIKEKLLGMDLVRLGLERSKTAREALEVITSLLGIHGQGGGCSNTMKNFTYHNSFLLADKKEAWVLETAGNFWAAENVKSGWRNISNSLSIGTKIDLSSRDLQAEAFKQGFWDGVEPFHFARVFSDDFTENEKSGRFYEGGRLLKKYSENNRFSLKSMMKILRDRPSGICMGCEGSFVSTSSQVSVLRSEGEMDCHWFTGTPDPEYSLFKPWVFLEGNELSERIRSEWIDPDSPRVGPGTDYRHELYKQQQLCYEKLVKGKGLREELRKVEDGAVEMVKGLVGDEGEEEGKIKGIFNYFLEVELEFYKTVGATK